MDTSSRVRTRRVHYISGFDPRGASYYHRVYREESVKQSALNSASLEIGGRTPLTDRVSRWQIEGQWEDETASTDYQFMHWDDLARKHWGSGLVWLLTKGITGYIEYLRCGALSKVCSICKSAFYCAIHPWLYFTGAGLLGILAGSATYAGLAFLPIPKLVGVLAGLLVAAFIAGAVASMANRVGITWLVRTYLFVHAWGKGLVPDLQERMDSFASHIIAEQKRDPVDEVLIVGHSIGALAAVSVASRILRQDDALSNHAHLITLGSCIPFLSLIPTANTFREELATVANDTRMPWTDIAVPSDPLCFFQIDPVKASGVASTQPDRPKLAVARIFRMFRPETYAKLRKDKFRVHFQYIMASELTAPYDYFRITAGPEKFSPISLTIES